MNTSSVHDNRFQSFFPSLSLRRGLLFGVIIIAALLSFEFFNYSTTDFALSDLLGDLDFLGVTWATILAIAFCGIDFAGIARLFTPEEGSDEPAEIWYLFAAWLLAATMNAMLTWWGVSIALLNHASLGNAVVSQATLLKVVPIFVAVMVWLIRVLIIGTFSVAGDRLFSQAERRDRATMGSVATLRRFGKPAGSVSPQTSMIKPAPKPVSYGRPEPTYQPLGMTARAPKGPSRGVKG